MASGVNKVILIGNLGADPEVRSFPDGGTIANINIATSESWTDRTTGQKQERTEWHRVVLRDRGNYRLGQIAAQYLRKGSKVFIDGRLQTRKWQDAQGVDRYTTEIIASEMQMLDSRAAGEGSALSIDNYGSNVQTGYASQQPQAPQQAYQQPVAPQQQAAAQRQPQAPQQRPAYQQPAPQHQPQQPAGSPPPFNDFEDDIPF